MKYTQKTSVNICVQRKHLTEGPYGRWRRILEGNIKTDHKEIGCENGGGG
jgi:hypothetical protein